MHKEQRRRILASTLVAGSSLQITGSWTKPVIETVFLPAHAQTTADAPPDVEPPSTSPGDGPALGPGFRCGTDRSTVPLGEEVRFRISPLDDATEPVSYWAYEICDGQIIPGRGRSGGTLLPGTSGNSIGITLPLDGSRCGIGSQIGFRIVNDATNETFDCQIPVALTTTTLSCSTDTADGTATLDQPVAFRFIASNGGDGRVSFDMEWILNGVVERSAGSATIQPGGSAGVSMTETPGDEGYQVGDEFGLRATRSDNGETLDCTVTLVEST